MKIVQRNDLNPQLNNVEKFSAVKSTLPNNEMSISPEIIKP
jgi:hypothetical protein